MSNARDAAVQQTFHTSPPLFTGLEIGTRNINLLALVTSTELLTALLNIPGCLIQETVLNLERIKQHLEPIMLKNENC
jgi:hypothetical protein